VEPLSETLRIALEALAVVDKMLPSATASNHQ
jgi:hypothetical protein